MTNTEAVRLWDLLQGVDMGQAGTWEVDFLDNVGTQINAGNNLSTAEGEKLEEIVERLTGRKP